MGFASGLSAGVAAGKAGREAWNERKISKGLSELDADQANRTAADDKLREEIGDSDEASGYERNFQDDLGIDVEGLTAYSPAEMASRRGAVYNKFGDPDGGLRYEDEATALREAKESTRRFDANYEQAADQFGITNANAVEANRLGGLRETRAAANDLQGREAETRRVEKEKETKLLNDFLMENSNPTSTQVKEFIASSNMEQVSLPEVRAAVKGSYGMGDEEIEQGRKQIKRDVAGLKTNSARMKYMSDSDLITPGFRYELEVDKNSKRAQLVKVNDQMVDDGKGTMVKGPKWGKRESEQSFQSEDDFGRWAIKEATENPEVALSYAMDSRASYKSTRAAAAQQVIENKIDVGTAWSSTRQDIIKSPHYLGMTAASGEGETKEENQANYLITEQDAFFEDSGVRTSSQRGSTGTGTGFNASQWGGGKTPTAPAAAPTTTTTPTAGLAGTDYVTYANFPDI